jgi:hypothetical protein
MSGSVVVPREWLEKLKRGHYYCEDPWYSCPKHEEGCANAGKGTECDCGADEWNAEIDRMLSLSPSPAGEAVAFTTMNYSDALKRGIIVNAAPSGEALADELAQVKELHRHDRSIPLTHDDLERIIAALRSQPEADGYAVVQADGYFVGAWQTQEMAENVQKRDKKSTVKSFAFVDSPPAVAVQGWAVVGPDGTTHSVTPNDTEEYAWQEFSEGSNWRTKDRTPDEWKAKGYRTIPVLITAAEGSAK